MSEDRLDRIVALLELLCKLGGANPHQIRHAGEVRAPEPEPEVKRSQVSVIRTGPQPRLVGEMRHQHPHEVDESGLPSAGGTMTPAEHWKRQPRGV